ncbi:uncharacterized protein JN550_003083 [Neoarthrinium moseri]|uniref:uncharacterized protein n=1 Tax=Neoarthrinium moseri TaxID=1658444 RepID=UPI001FDB4B0C|nr:uncharacterized protein JN550_003083 [Neoarthrinium moseri]KAI1873814.1 hypothetical protein JN550_003083 [Neoarthrinium moseri]
MIITTYRYFRRKYGPQEPRTEETTQTPKKISPPCHHRSQGEHNEWPSTDNEECLQCKAEQRALRKYRWKIILALILPYCLQSLDITIVASALPWIASDFDEIAQLNWIISAFNLTSAAFIPFWGQAADAFGRHWSLQTTMILMLIGSAFCTAAPTNAFALFLLGRAIQGIGCAGIGTIIRVVLADKVSLKENARNWTVFTLTGGASYGLGPVIGGYLTKVNWRWCFGINLPIGVVGMATVFLVRDEMLGPQSMPGLNEHGAGRRQRFAKRLGTIDSGGQLLFLFGFGLLVLALTWAGATYDWNSAQVVSTLVLGILIVAAFLFYEYLMIPGKALAQRLSHQKPMMPWYLLKNRNISLLFYINFATGMAMYSVLYFSDIYFTMVKHFTPDEAGVQLLFYTPGLGAGVYLSMLFCNRWPRNTFVPLLLGSVVEAFGVGLLAWALYFEHNPTIYGMIALTGAGTGLRFMPGSLHAIGFFPNDIATVTALMGVAMPFGGTLALTIMATVFNNTSGIGRDSPFRDFSTLDQQPADVLAQVTESARNGITWAFVALTPFMVLCIMCSSCLGNVTIDPRSSVDDLGQGRGGHLTHGSYLLSLFRGKTSQRDNIAEEERQLQTFTRE